MKITNIALNKLIPSTANVRKTGASIGIDELAASIEAHGLLQNLQVRKGKDGKFEVVAGGTPPRRAQVARQEKRLPKADAIPCHVLDDEDAAEISLAENVVRLPMHPADQYEAFKAMADAGRGPEEIAGRFGCTRGGRQAAAQAGVGQPALDRALPRRGNDARPTHGLHRQRRSRGAGGRMVRAAAMEPQAHQYPPRPDGGACGSG